MVDSVAGDGHMTAELSHVSSDTSSAAVQDDQQGHAQSITIAVDKVTRTVQVTPWLDKLVCRKPQKPKDLIKDVSLVMEAGDLCGILGPSGSGKTSLLNTIAGRSRVGKLTGTVTFNGLKETKRVRDFTNYVTAADRLHAYLTVEETIDIASKLKLPKLEKIERKAHVERVIKQMSLTRCRKNYIGGEWKKGISTGEMKRVAIAIELLDDPQVLLLDEPTSGLDSGMALEIVQELKALSLTGKTVVMTVHQPRSQLFALLDQAILLSKGEVVYSGAPHDMTSYFTRLGYNFPADYNPADYVMDLVSDSTISESGSSAKSKSFNSSSSKSAVEPVDVVKPSKSAVHALSVAWQSSKEHARICDRIALTNANPKPLPKNPNTKTTYDRDWRDWPSEFTALYLRFSLNSLRNPIVCFLMIVIQAIQGLLLGGIFFQIDNPPVPGVLDYTQYYLNATWASVYTYGVDGQGYRPFVEIVESGVDGEGSHPLSDLLARDAGGLGDTLQCLYTAYGLDAKVPPYPQHIFTAAGFDATAGGSTAAAAGGSAAAASAGTDGYNLVPTMPEEFLIPSQRFRSNLLSVLDDIRYGARASVGKDSEYHQMVYDIKEQSEPHVWDLSAQTGKRDVFSIYTNAMTLLQLVDWFVFHIDYTEARSCYDQRADVLQFYICVMFRADYVLNPLLGCFGMPPLPGAGLEPPTPPVRLLSVSVPSEDEVAKATSVVIPEFSDFTASMSALVDRLSKCEHSICKALQKAVDNTRTTIKDSVASSASAFNIAGCLYFTVANLGFASYDAVLSFPQEKAIFNHEVVNGLYSTSSYYLAKNLAGLPFQLVPPMVLITVYYFMVGFGSTAGQFFAYFALCVLITFCSYGFGYLISALSSRLEIAITIAPLLLTIYLVLAGFFLPDPLIPAWINWFKYLTFFRWAWFALCINRWRPGGTFGYLSNEFVLNLLNITNQSLWFNSLMLFVLAIVYRILGYFALKYMHRGVGLNV